MRGHFFGAFQSPCSHSTRVAELIVDPTCGAAIQIGRGMVMSLSKRLENGCGRLISGTRLTNHRICSKTELSPEMSFRVPSATAVSTIAQLSLIASLLDRDWCLRSTGFLGAMSALSTRPKLLESIFVSARTEQQRKRCQKYGIYILKFYKWVANDEHTDIFVVIDDRIPVRCCVLCW